MSFRYERVIRFHETDAAGVVYFANVLTLCHEAYEAALEAAGFDVGLFFSKDGDVAVPIIHAESDFHQPLRCGDGIAITLTPAQITEHSFEISYQVYYCLGNYRLEKGDVSNESDTVKNHKAAAIALTRHLCIDPQTRRRQPLAPELTNWITSLAEPAVPNG